MTSNQPTLNFSLRQPGRPRVFTKEEIKERRKEQWRRYMKNKKTNQSKEPISTSVKYVGHPRIYTEEEAQQRKRERVQKYYRENRDKKQLTQLPKGGNKGNKFLNWCIECDPTLCYMAS